MGHLIRLIVKDISSKLNSIIANFSYEPKPELISG